MQLPPLIPLPNFVLLPPHLLRTDEADGFFVQAEVIVPHLRQLVYFVNRHTIQLPQFLFQYFLHAWGELGMLAGRGVGIKIHQKIKLQNLIFLSKMKIILYKIYLINSIKMK